MEKITIHNTRSGQKEEFVPRQPGQLGLYCCGPTVYNFAHIGNLRSYLFEDVLRRTFAFFDYRVRHVMNITDIGHLTDDADAGEDKMVQSAQRQNKSIRDIANFYTDAFFADCAVLNILRPDIVCRATEHIDDMIALVQRIQAQGYAYHSAGNVYFDTAKFADYGLGARAITDQDVVRARVSADTAKRNPADFVLWFTRSKHERHAMLWDSPWGSGYPGWHLECSAMSMRYLGEEFDMHCGGIDHVPVHHTNEIAQVEAVTGKCWVRYWVHGEFLLMNEQKLSKSTGSFITLPDLHSNGFSPLDFRYLCLGSHYRSQLRFSHAALSTARNARLRLQERITHLTQRTGPPPQMRQPAGAAALSARAQTLYRAGRQAIANDLNSPQLLSTVWAIAKAPELSAPERIWLMQQFDTILGLDILAGPRGEETERQGSELADAEIAQRLQARERARKNKEWQVADDIRAQLQRAGITIVDGADGTTWFRS